MLQMLDRRRQPALDDANAGLALAADLHLAGLHDDIRTHLATIEIATGDADAAIGGLEQAAEAARADGDLGRLSLVLSMLGTGGGERRRYTVARKALAEALDVDRQSDNEIFEAYNSAWLARIDFEQGEWDLAAARARSVLEYPTAAEAPIGLTASGTLGRLAVRRGTSTPPSELVDIAAEAHRNVLQYVWAPVCGLAEWHWLAGHQERVSEIVSSLLVRAFDSDSEWARGEVAFWAWRGGTIERPPGSVPEPFESLMTGAWQDAAARWRELGCPYEEATALAEGDPDAQRAAIDIFDRLGARPAASIARRSLRQAGENAPPAPSRRTKQQPAGLTRRQVEVLRLIADGLSNGEIAAREHLAKKTVEHHVSAIFTKLGVSSRTAAVARARDLGALENGGAPR